MDALRRSPARLDGSDGNRAQRACRGTDRACADLLVVVVGGYDRYHARCCRCVQRAHDDIAARLDLGLAAREVDDIHPVSDCGFDSRDDSRRVRIRTHTRVGLDEDLVIPDVRARGDAGDDQSGTYDRLRVSGGDAGDVRAVGVIIPVERELSARLHRAGRRKRAGDDHLGRRELLLALRETGRHRVARRVEERMARVDPGVEDADLHALAGGRERGSPERRSTDLAGAAIELRRVRSRLVHVADSGNLPEGVDLCARQSDREAVYDEPVTPVDARVRKPRRELGPKCLLLGVDRGASSWRFCQRRRCERDDDLRLIAGVVGSCRRSRKRERDEDGDR